MSHHSPPPEQQQQQYYGHLPPQQSHMSMYQAPQPVPPQYHQQALPASPVHVSPKGMWASKLTLRLISIIFSIVILGIGASVQSDLNSLSFYSFSYDSYDDYYMGFPGPLLFLGPSAAVAIVWSFAEAICICVRGGHRGIHPGACVGIDLILWLSFVGGATTLALVYWWIFSPFSSYQNPLITFVFGVIEIAIHFTLFVIACYETNVRNRRSTLVYVQPGQVNMNTIVPPASGPPVATPYSNKEPVVISQPAVARKPLETSTESTVQSWEQQNVVYPEPFRTPDTSTPPYQTPSSPGIPATYRPNERY